MQGDVGALPFEDESFDVGTVNKWAQRIPVLKLIEGVPLYSLLQGTFCQ